MWARRYSREESEPVREREGRGEGDRETETETEGERERERKHMQAVHQSSYSAPMSQRAIFASPNGPLPMTCDIGLANTAGHYFLHYYFVFP